MITYYFQKRAALLFKKISSFLLIPIINLMIFFNLGIILSEKLAILAILLLFSFIITRIKRVLILSIAFCLIGFLTLTSTRNILATQVSELANKEVTLEAVVVEEPILRDFDQEVILTSSEYYGYFKVTIPKYIEVSNGDKITVKASFKEPESFTNFDYKSYLLTRRIVLESEKAEVLKIEAAKGLPSFINNIKSTLLSKLKMNLNEPAQSLASGMLFGTRADLSEALEENLKNSGTYHIISVSGFNVTMIFNFILLFTILIRRNRLLVLSLIFIWIYLYLVGFNNLPALRATIMITFIVVGKVLGRSSTLIIPLLISTTAILLIYPLYYTNISFQLSTGAFIGLILFSKFFTNLRLTSFKENLTSTLSATIGTLPITLSTFRSLNLTGIMSNLFILPLVPIIMLTGGLIIISELINLKILAKLLTLPLELLVNFIDLFISFFGKLNTFNFTNIINPIPYLSITFIMVVVLDFINFRKNEAIFYLTHLNKSTIN